MGPAALPHGRGRGGGGGERKKKTNQKVADLELKMPEIGRGWSVLAVPSWAPVTGTARAGVMLLVGQPWGKPQVDSGFFKGRGKRGMCQHGMCHC